jgi:micrococcal nuclease
MPPATDDSSIADCYYHPNDCSYRLGPLVNRRARIFVKSIGIGLIVLTAFLVLRYVQSSPGNDLIPPASTSSVTMVVPTPSLQSTLPANAVPVDLVRIVDGDTIVVRIKGESGQETVRLIGIDTPETKKPNTPVQCYGKEATAFTTKLLTGKKIWLEPDKSNRDQYGRLLRYVWVESGSSYLLANEEIVTLGFGTAGDYPPDTHYHKRLFAALDNARSHQLGIWGSCELKAQGTFVPGAPDWWTGGDLDCADFASQKDAQAFFEAMGGPENDPDSLDEDGDGVVCRSLP